MIGWFISWVSKRFNHYFAGLTDIVLLYIESSYVAGDAMVYNYFGVGYHHTPKRNRAIKVLASFIIILFCLEIPKNMEVCKPVKWMILFSREELQVTN